jgi:DNA (cytosine-5)-methyltransferase 1
MIAMSLNAHGGSGRSDAESETFVVAPTLDASFARLQGCSGQDLNNGHSHLIAHSASVSQHHAPTLDKSKVAAVAFAQNQLGEVRCGDVFNTLNQNSNASGRNTPMVASSAVRRLTPRECERLQGFQDDYTLIPYRGRPAADGPRYKALGNSMAVPCMAWIGRRIAAAEVT